MKKLTLSLVTLVALAFAPGWAKADSSIPVTINGQAVEMNMPPALYDDTLLVPVESIVDRLGAQMSWDDQLQLLTLQKGSSSVQLMIGTTKCMVNGKEDLVEAAPRLIEGQKMVPLRLIGEALNYRVSWNNTDRSVNLDPLQ